MNTPAVDGSPPFVQPKTASYSVDHRRMRTLSVAALGPWFLILQSLKLVYPAVALVFVLATDSPPLIGALVFLFLGIQLQVYVGLRHNTVALVKQVGGGDRIDYLVTIDADGIELRAGDHVFRIRWGGFSGHYISRDHLALQRGGVTAVSLPMGNLSPPFVAAIHRHLAGAQVPERQPPTYRLPILLYGASTAMLAALAYWAGVVQVLA